MSKQHKALIELYSGIRVDSPETLAEVLRLLDSLDDLKAKTFMPGLSRLRVREETKKTTEQPKGRRFVG